MPRKVRAYKRQHKAERIRRLEEERAQERTDVARLARRLERSRVTERVNAALRGCAE